MSRRTLNTSALFLVVMALTLSPFPALCQTQLLTSYYDLNANIHQISWSNGVPHDVNTGFQGQPPALFGSMTSLTNGALPHTFHIGPSGHVYDLYNQGGSWHNFDVTAAAGAPPALAFSPLASFVNPANGQMHVYYKGPSSGGVPHVLELYWIGGTTWKWFDPTAAASAPDMVGDSLACFYANGVIHVYYVNQFNHIQELYWTGGTTWKAFDPTAASGGALAAFGAIAVFFYNGQIHVYYLGANDAAVHELTWLGGTAWAASCPSCAAGAPLILSINDSLPAFVDTSTGRIHVYYAGGGSLIELVGSNGSWMFNYILSTPFSPSTVDAFFTGGALSIWVHYIDSNSNLHALDWDGVWSDVDITSFTGILASSGSNGDNPFLTSYLP